MMRPMEAVGFQREKEAFKIDINYFSSCKIFQRPFCIYSIRRPLICLYKDKIVLN